MVPTITTDRQTCNRGKTNGHKYFLPSKWGGGGSPPAPVLGRGGLFNLPGPLRQPQIISSFNSCSRGGPRSVETYSCPSPTAAHPCRGLLDPAPRVRHWDQLPQPLLDLSPCELFGIIWKSFLFLAATRTVWKIKDRAAPCKLYLVYSLKVAKPRCDDRNTRYLQGQVSDWAILWFIFSVLRINTVFFDQHTSSVRRLQDTLFLIYTPSTWTERMLFAKFNCHEALRAVCSVPSLRITGKGFGLSAWVFSVLEERGEVCQSAEGDFWTGGLSRWWMSLLTGRPFSTARFAQLESEQNKRTDWPNTNGPLKRFVSDLLTLGHKDLAAVMRTKGLKDDASSNWTGFPSTKGTGTRALTAFHRYFWALFCLTLPIAVSWRGSVWMTTL